MQAIPDFPMMKPIRLVAFAMLALVSGCVIAPIPLIQTECHCLWTGIGPDGTEMTIEALEKTWYMPIVASAEGPSKERSSETQYTYYAEDGKSTYREDHVPDQRAVHLPWLDQKVKGNYEWGDCGRIEGTPCWYIRRVLDFDDAHRGAQGPRVWQIEYVVFDLKSLKSRTTLPVVCTNELMCHYDDKTRSIEHQTSSGWKRHGLLDGSNEDISMPAWAH